MSNNFQFFLQCDSYIYFDLALHWPGEEVSDEITSGYIH